MNRYPSPDLPDEPPLPETEPRGALQPPGRRPPTALATADYSADPDPALVPSVYPRRLNRSGRIARVFLAVVILVSASYLRSTGMPAQLLWLSAGLLAPMLFYATLFGEGVERSIDRRFRWFRRRRYRLRRAKRGARALVPPI